MVGEPVGTQTSGAAASAAGATGRPTGIAILAVLDFLWAGGFLVGALALFTLGGFAGALGQGSGVATFLVALGAVAGIFLLVAAGVVGVLGWGLWTGKTWAWWVQVVLEALAVVGGLLALLSGDITQVLWVGLAGFILWYLLRPWVKRYFSV